MTLTESCVAQLTRLFLEENNPDLMLRVFVQGGGCSGFQYGFAFEDTQNDDDFEFVHGSVRVLVDAMSMQYLQGGTIDYREDAMGSTFVIDNPQATTTCGCGSSFSV
jgi:iron-sulfur cluster insertion protein